MQCHWWTSRNTAATKCQQEGTEFIPDLVVPNAGLWYCERHFNQVMANREWLLSRFPAKPTEAPPHARE